MPQQGYSIGRDVTVAVILSNGTALRLGKVLSFDAKQVTSEEEIVGLDGVVDHLRFYKGWTGSIKMERRSPDLDNYFATLEANYWAGVGEDTITIQQTISEPNGSVSQWRYERVLLKYDDPATWEADKSVTQSLSFVAAKRIKQA